MGIVLCLSRPLKDRCETAPIGDKKVEKTAEMARPIQDLSKPGLSGEFRAAEFTRIPLLI
jgi:hypothetical protein